MSQIIKEIIENSPEVAFCYERGLINLTSLAEAIHKQVEIQTSKKVKIGSVVTALARIQKTIIKPKESKKILFEYIHTVLPVRQLFYKRQQNVIEEILEFQKSKKYSLHNEWMTWSSNTSSIIVSLSEQMYEKLSRVLTQKTEHENSDLVTILLGVPQEYQNEDGVLYHIVRRFARKKIPLVDVITNRGEIAVLIHSKHLVDVLTLLQQ